MSGEHTELIPEGDERASEDELMARVLRAARPRPTLPEDLRSRWENRFRMELQQAARRRNRTKLGWYSGAIAASLAIVALTMTLSGRNAIRTPEAAMATVVWSNAALPGMALGSLLRVGDVRSTGAGQRVALNVGGMDVRMDERSEIRLLPQSRIELRSGALYVDSGYVDSGDNADRAINALEVVTALGSVHHLGTQYFVRIAGDTLTTAVREGHIQLRRQHATQDLAATPGVASLARVSPEGVRISHIPSYGDVWNWISDAAPSMAFEGRSADDFLRRLTHESGQTLRYLDEDARRHAQATQLHGTDATLSGAAALDVIAATTRLSIVATPDKSGVVVGLRAPR